jgi:hypothetical protein
VVLANASPLLFDPKKENASIAILDGHSNCLEERGGERSLYRVFALPHVTTPYIITVAVQRWGNTILAPRIMLLDGAGAIKRETAHADFVFRGDSLSTLLRSHADENYLVLSSDTTARGQSVSRITETLSVGAVAAGPAIFALYTGTETTSNLSLAPVGTVAITLSAFPTR